MPSSDEQAEAPQAELAHGAGEAALVLDVAADDEHERRPEPAAARRRHGARAPARPRRARVAEDAAAGARRDLGRHAVEVAGDLAAGGVDQEIEARARLGRRCALDRAHERAAPAGLELLAQSRSASASQRLQHLVGQRSLALPGRRSPTTSAARTATKAHHVRRASARKAVVETAQRGSSQGRHGSCIRRRARCAAAACRSSCRSWPCSRETCTSMTLVCGSK